MEGCITGLAAQLTGGAGYCEMGVEVGTYILSESTGGVYGKVKSGRDAYKAVSKGKSAYNDIGNRTRQIKESTSRINQYEGVLMIGRMPGMQVFRIGGNKWQELNRVKHKED